jgi:hypothetical protein
MAKITNAVVKFETPKINRPGVHSKAKTSSLKSSKNYKKKYNSQGRV